MKSEKTIYLLLFAFLGVIVGYFISVEQNNDVFAQIGIGEKGDVIVMPLAVGDNGGGLAIVDVRLEKIMIYEVIGSRSGLNKLKLVAVRNYSYDKLLDEYNNVDPTPEFLREKLLSGKREIDGNVDSSKEQDLTDLVVEPGNN